MKTIPLTQGKIAFVDDEDFEELNKYKWYANISRNVWYARRNTKRINGKQEAVLMHQQITGFNHKIIDHRNGNGLDNQKCNLRSCTNSQNTINHKHKRNNTSGLVGVSWHKLRRKWEVRITKDYQHIALGYFNDKNEAGYAYDKKAIELFGEFASLNFNEVKI